MYHKLIKHNNANMPLLVFHNVSNNFVGVEERDYYSPIFSLILYDIKWQNQFSIEQLKHLEVGVKIQI